MVATLYEHHHYAGWNVVFGTGSYDLHDLRAKGVPNDRASSLRISPGWRITVYEHAGFRGKSKEFTEDHPTFATIAWNDIVSSMVVTGPSPTADALGSSSPSLPVAVSTETVFDRAMHAVCNLLMLMSGGWYVGTGFITEVDGERVVCTVAHNVMNSHRDDLASRVIVAIHRKGGLTPVQAECDMSRCFVAGAADLAILRLQDSSYLQDADVLPIATTAPATGSTCYVLGNPAGFDVPSLSEGLIRDLNYSTSNLVESVAVSAPVYGGNSGSPIMSPEGAVVGIISYAASASSSAEVSCLAWGASWRVIRPVLTYLKGQSRHLVGGYLGAGAVPLPVRAHPYRATGAALVGYDLGAPAFGIGTDEVILEINGNTAGCYPGYASLVEIYLNPGQNVLLGVTGPHGNRDVVVVPLALPRTLDVPEGSGSSPLTSRLLGPIAASKEISPESAQDGGSRNVRVQHG